MYTQSLHLKSYQYLQYGKYTNFTETLQSKVSPLFLAEAKKLGLSHGIWNIKEGLQKVVISYRTHRVQSKI